MTDESITIAEAAGAMGRKGGTVVSEKKLAALRKNIKKAIGQKKGKKYPGIFDLERRAKKVMKKKKSDEPALQSMAAILGRKGGSVKSDRKTAACRLNARGGVDGKGKHAGRPALYHFTKQAPAVLGVRARHSCIIPDEVAASPKKYLGKTFPAFYTGAKGKELRAKARIVSISKKEIILMQYFTRPGK